MRLLVIALVGCTRVVPLETVDVSMRSGLGGARHVQVRLSELGVRELTSDCRLAIAQGDPVIQCPDRRVMVRFDCAAHPAGSPLELMVDLEAVSLHCK